MPHFLQDVDVGIYDHNYLRVLLLLTKISPYIKTLFRVLKLALSLFDIME